MVQTSSPAPDNTVHGGADITTCTTQHRTRWCRHHHLHQTTSYMVVQTSSPAPDNIVHAGADIITCTRQHLHGGADITTCTTQHRTRWCRHHHLHQTTSYMVVQTSPPAPDNIVHAGADIITCTRQHLHGGADITTCTRQHRTRWCRHHHLHQTTSYMVVQTSSTAPDNTIHAGADIAPCNR